MNKLTPRQAKAVRVRDRALVLVRESGSWEQCGDMKLIAANRGALKVLYRTPFQELPRPSDSHLYFLAVYGGKTNLPYGLDVWDFRPLTRGKVLNIEWSDEGEIQLISYKPGDWEDELPSETIDYQGAASETGRASAPAAAGPNILEIFSPQRRGRPN